MRSTRILLILLAAAIVPACERNETTILMDSDKTPPAAPVLTGTTPGSPNLWGLPSVQGTAEAGSTVRLYTQANCAGPVVGVGEADVAGNFSVVLTKFVTGNVTTNFFASAADAAGNVSPCSSPLPYFSPVLAPRFASAGNFGAAARPLGVAVGDVDRDGVPDLAVADDTSDLISILIGNGDGTFQLPADTAGGDDPVKAILFDLDGDGFLDLAIANRGGNAATVRRGNGDGSFQGPDTYALIGGPESVTAGDLNSDGIPDLVLGSAGGGVHLLIGVGDATFQPSTTLPSPTPGARALQAVLGDLNDDGKLDIVTADDNPGRVFVWLGNGDGSFGAPAGITSGSGTMSVALADFDGDGRLDAATADFHAGTVSVHLGNGDGTLQAAAPLAVGGEPIYVAAGDLNGDGRPDLAVADFGTTLKVLVGHGDGTFDSPVPFGTGAVGTQVAIADLNGDGRPDLAVSNLGSTNVTVLLSLP